MKNSTNDGFNQHYNVQVAVEQESFMVVANGLSSHPNDNQEAEPMLDAIDPRLGKPEAAAMDSGYFSEANITACEQRSINPIIATGKEAHYLDLETLLAEQPEAPNEDASPREKMAYKLQIEAGKEIIGFRQFSLRGLLAAAGEWCLVCLAFNLKRMHSLFQAQGLLKIIGCFNAPAAR
jgi:hypothetical protein